MDTIYESIKMMGIGVGVYVYAIFLLRLVNTRIGLRRPFDLAIVILIGSVLGRIVNGNAAVIPTLCAAFILIMLHHLFAFISYHSDWIGKVLKGKAQLLVSNGEIDWEKMKACRITEEDLLEEARKNKIAKLKDVKKACLERDGNVSFFE